jgi:hypothetical protein
MEKYAYNRREGDYANKTFFVAKMEHTFDSHCGVLDELQPFYYGASIIFFVVLCIWSLFVFVIRKQSTYSVQKVLTLVPVAKGFETLIYWLDHSKCPWADDMEVEAYLKMGKVTAVTFTYTFIHAVLFMLCKGWSTTNRGIDRD